MTLNFEQADAWLRKEAERFASEWAKPLIDEIKKSTDALLADPKTTNLDLVQRYHDLNAHVDTLSKTLQNLLSSREYLEKIKLAMLDRLNEAKTNSFNTDAGTAYKRVLLKGKVTDREKFLDHCLENWDNGGNDMLLIGAPAVEALREYIETNKTAPPGVETSTHTNVNITKG